MAVRAEGRTADHGVLGAAVAASVVLGECENRAGSYRGSTAKGLVPFCRGQDMGRGGAPKTTRSGAAAVSP